MNKITQVLADSAVADTISRILQKGNSAELKKENGKLVVVEIERKVKIKTSLNG